MPTTRSTTYENPRSIAQTGSFESIGEPTESFLPPIHGKSRAELSMSPDQIAKEMEDEDKLFQAMEELLFVYMTRPHRHAPVRTRFQSDTYLEPTLKYSFFIIIKEHHP